MTASAGPALEELYAQLGDRVTFATPYVREAHPGGRHPQPRELETKQGFARDHSAYLVARDGTVVYRQLWANDVDALRRALEALLGGAATPLGQSEAKLVPMLRGVGAMEETLEQAGPEALDDLRREAPPVWAMASLAGLFRPLPPLGRSLAAVGISAAILALLGSAAWRGSRRLRGERSSRLRC